MVEVPQVRLERIGRDLHDGAQARLVALAMERRGERTLILSVVPRAEHPGSLRSTTGRLGGTLSQ